MTEQERKAAAFQALHGGEPFVIPNPWDAGSARVLAALGFKALASTSSGFAFTLGRLDSNVTLDEVVAHAAMLDGATDLPVSVDLENGYGAEPASAALAITRVADAARSAPRSRTTTPEDGSTSAATPPSGSLPPPKQRIDWLSHSC
jgi:2-methylisocitrate lyase-like PEP mutase family enzyme